MFPSLASLSVARDTLKRSDVAALLDALPPDSGSLVFDVGLCGRCEEATIRPDLTCAHCEFRHCSWCRCVWLFSAFPPPLSLRQLNGPQPVDGMLALWLSTLREPQ